MKYVKRLPLDSFVPLDTHNNLFFYIIGFLHQYGSMLFFGTYISSADALFCGVMMHIHAQYLILKNSLENYLDRAIDVYNKEDESSDHKRLKNDENFDLGDIPASLSPYTMKILKDCIKHHHKIISMSIEAEDIFRYITFCQILASLMIICFSLLQITVVSISYLYNK